MADEVVTERQGRVLIARLNRPKARNALDSPLCRRLHAILDEAAADSEVSVLALGSTDPTCFSAGMDTKEALQPGAPTLDVLLDVQWALEIFPKPLIGMLGGYTIGGGAELALSMDIRIGSPETVMAFPGTGYGLAQGSWHLVDVVGKSRALELVLTGRRVGAEECLELSLLHESAEDPDVRGIEVATQLSERSDAAMRESKRMIVAAWGKPQRERFDEERMVNGSFMSGGEVGERMGRKK